MKQLLQNLRAKVPHLAEVPVPTPPAGFVLVRNAASLVSAGTERALVEFAGLSLLGKAKARPDLLKQAMDKARREGVVSAANAAFGRLGEPMPLGYSSAGVVAELGQGVQGFRVGQRVACAGGGYAVHAEYVLVPKNLLAAVPSSVDLEDAAFTTLGAIALHGFRLSEAHLGERVAVIGLGLLGQLACSLAEDAGCRVLGIDLNTKRVELARKRGFAATLRKGAYAVAASKTDGKGFDVVLICADTDSNDPVELAGEIARDRAKVVAIGAVGLEIPRRSYYAKELSLIVSRSYGPGRYDPSYEELGHDYPISYVRWTEGRNLQAFVDLLANGKVNVKDLISHRFPIEKAPKAYELIQSDRDFLGVLITYAQTAAKVSAAKRIEINAKPISKDKIGLGVFGAGNFARNTILPAIKSLRGVELVGIASASGRPAADLARRFGFRYATSDATKILDDRKVDAVAVLTRHNLHASQILAALKEGKHVFCEKPIALNEKELAAIERAAAKRGAPILTVGFNRRFAPLALELQKFLADRKGPLAANYRVNAGQLPLYHWLHDPERGGGRLVGEACHFIDFIIFLVGQSPVSVSAQALPDSGEYRQDNFELTMRFADGSMGTVTYLANGDRSLAKERLEVFSGGKVAVLDDFRALDLTSDGRTSYIRRNQDKGHRAAWKAFLGSLHKGGQPPIPYDQIFSGARVAFAALRSLETGKSIDL